MEALKETLKLLSQGETLSATQATKAFEILLDGEATPSQIGAFLMGLQQRGETVEEIAAGAQVMRKNAIRVKAPDHALDTYITPSTTSGVASAPRGLAVSYTQPTPSSGSVSRLICPNAE